MSRKCVGASRRAGYGFAFPLHRADSYSCNAASCSRCPVAIAAAPSHAANDVLLMASSRAVHSPPPPMSNYGRCQVSSHTLHAYRAYYLHARRFLINDSTRSPMSNYRCFLQSARNNGYKDHSRHTSRTTRTTSGTRRQPHQVLDSVHAGGVEHVRAAAPWHVANDGLLVRRTLATASDEQLCALSSEFPYVAYLPRLLTVRQTLPGSTLR